MSDELIRLIVYFFFMLAFYFFTHSLFRYHKSFMHYLVCYFAISLPCFIMYHHMNSLFGSIISFLYVENIYMFIIRQFLLLYFTYTSFKAVFTYQFVFSFSYMFCYQLDFFVLYTLSSFISHEMLCSIFTLLWKMLMVMIVFLLTQFLYEKIEVNFIRKRDLVIFSFVFFIYVASEITASWLLIIIYDVFILIVLYFYLRKMFQLKQIQNQKKNEKRELNDIQNQFQQQKESLETLDKVRHDEKNHMLTFENLYKRDPQQAMDYIHQWHKVIKNNLQ